MEENIVRDNLNYSPATLDANSFSKLNSHCSPVVDLRAYKEEKFRPHKSEDVGRWTYKNQRPWMICHGSEVFDSSFSSSPNDKLMLESMFFGKVRLQSYSPKKQRGHKLTKPKITEKLLEDILEEEDVCMDNNGFTVECGSYKYFSQLPDVGQKDDISALKRYGMHIHRCRLEKEVERLQAVLEQEKEISIAFETALSRKPGALSQFSHLPLDAQELLADLATLEAAVSSLEEQIISVLSKFRDEICPQRQILETFGGRFPLNMSPVHHLLKTLSISTL